MITVSPASPNCLSSISVVIPFSASSATCHYETFHSPEEALLYLENVSYPVVLKADGLALGKGVLICNTPEEAENGITTLMLDNSFPSIHASITSIMSFFMRGSTPCACGSPKRALYSRTLGPSDCTGTAYLIAEMEDFKYVFICRSGEF